jgi:hypothetical protein
LKGNFEIMTCDVRQADCGLAFTFDKGAKLMQFQGRPPSANEVSAVLETLVESPKA